MGSVLARFLATPATRQCMAHLGPSRFFRARVLLRHLRRAARPVIVIVLLLVWRLRTGAS